MLLHPKTCKCKADIVGAVEKKQAGRKGRKELEKKKKERKPKPERLRSLKKEYELWLTDVRKLLSDNRSLNPPDTRLSTRTSLLFGTSKHQNKQQRMIEKEPQIKPPKPDTEISREKGWREREAVLPSQIQTG